MKNQQGLIKKYFIQKVTSEGLKPVDKNAEYFILRLDESDSNDIEHIKACRVAINAYADAVKHHLPVLSEELKNKYSIIED